MPDRTVAVPHACIRYTRGGGLFMKRIFILSILLYGFLPVAGASAESQVQPPCVCNDDCYYNGMYCNDWGWGTYCDYSSPGIPCTDAGIPDAGPDADADAEPVPPDVPFTQPDVRHYFDSQPPDDVAEIPDGDVAPMSLNRGCVCIGGGDAPPGLPVLLGVFLALTFLLRRHR